MSIVQSLRNKLRGAIQRWGPAGSKRALWNKEFGSGYWRFIDDTADDVIYEFLGKYARGGSILDLGCGAGNTAAELRAEAYTTYLGVDISDVALAQARARSEAAGRNGKNRFVQSEICSYKPEGQYDVVLFRESLFYVPARRIGHLLEQLRPCLGRNGVFLIRIMDRESYQGVCDAVRANASVLECYAPPDRKLIILACR